MITSMRDLAGLGENLSLERLVADYLPTGSPLRAFTVDQAACDDWACCEESSGGIQARRKTIKNRYNTSW